MVAFAKLREHGVDLENLAGADVVRIYEEYEKLANNYACAIKEVETKLEIMDADFKLLHEHNPIHHMQSRVKSFESLMEKVVRQEVKPDIENIIGNIFDIAGIRVVCPYIDDIYTIKDLLKAQKDIEVLVEKDYIANPKPNGYRSLHMVVRVPVFFVSGVREMPVEVQIRTIAMDFWATLEHKLRYKSKGEIPKFIQDELFECAIQITESDLKMQKIHNFLQGLDMNTTNKFNEAAIRG